MTRNRCSAEGILGVKGDDSSSLRWKIGKSESALQASVRLYLGLPVCPYVCLSLSLQLSGRFMSPSRINWGLGGVLGGLCQLKQQYRKYTLSKMVLWSNAKLLVPYRTFPWQVPQWTFFCKCSIPVSGFFPRAVHASQEPFKILCFWSIFLFCDLSSHHDAFFQWAPLQLMFL